MTVADRIKQLREAKGWSQEELASRMGYTGKSSISKIETSGNDITLKKISRLAKALNTSESYLMGWVQSPSADYDPKALDNVYTDTAEDEYTSEETEKAIRLYEEYQNAPDDVRSVIDRLLKSSQSQP